MGTLEIIILVAVVLTVVAFVIIYIKNSKKIKVESSKTEQPKEETPKPEETVTPVVKNDIKSVSKDINDQSENYIKSIMTQDDSPKNTTPEVQFEEVSKEELLLDDDEDKKDGAIVLGVKKHNVHIIDDDDDEDEHENSTSILNDLDTNEEYVITKKIRDSLSVEDLVDQDNETKEEFNKLSKRMKILMVSNVFGRKKQ